MPVQASPASPLPGPGAHCTRFSFSWGAGSHPAAWSRGGAFNSFGVRSVARSVGVQQLQAGCFGFPHCWPRPHFPAPSGFPACCRASCPVFCLSGAEGWRSLLLQWGLGRSWLSGCVQPAGLQPAPCFINFPGGSSVAVLEWEGLGQQGHQQRFTELALSTEQSHRSMVLHAVMGGNSLYYRADTKL